MEPPVLGYLCTMLQCLRVASFLLAFLQFARPDTRQGSRKISDIFKENCTVVCARGNITG